MPPENLTPARKIYVIWAETPGGRTSILGQLRVDDDLEAEFVTVSPLEKFRLIVTAEDEGAPLHPSPQLILSTAVFDAV